MGVSIFARSNVILGVTRQILAKPSCITTAAKSACCVGSQASSGNNMNYGKNVFKSETRVLWKSKSSEEMGNHISVSTHHKTPL